MLKTWEFGEIRILKANKINRLFDTFIRADSVYEWEFWQLTSGEIVAVAIEE